MYEEKEPYNLRLLIIILFVIILFVIIGRDKIFGSIRNLWDGNYSIAYNVDTVKVDIIKPKEISYIVIDTIDDSINNIDTINTKLTTPTVKPSSITTTNSTPKKLIVDTTTLPIVIPKEEMVVEKVKEKEVKIQVVDSVKSTAKTEPTKKKKSIFNIFKRVV